MSCGIICRRDAYSPYAELSRIQRMVDRLPGTPRKPKIDQFERWLFGGLGVVAVIGGIGILSTLAYVAISAIVATI